MKGYMIRGQGAGILTDRIYARPPTEDELKAALALELASHGIKFSTAQDESGATVITGATAKDRWVMVIDTEIVGVGGPDPAPIPEDQRKIVGRLNDKELEELVAQARKGPPGTMHGGMGVMTMEGTGTVTNPGDPGYVPPAT